MWLNAIIGAIAIAQNIPSAALYVTFLSRSVRNVEVRLRSSLVRRLQMLSIAYHYPPEMPQTVLASFGTRDKACETLALGKPEQLKIKFTGLKPGAKIVVETLDQQNGNALAAWESLGKPDNLSREQTKLLREKAAATKKESFAADANGCFKLERFIEPWSLVLIQEL